MQSIDLNRAYPKISPSETMSEDAAAQVGRIAA